MGFCTHKAKPPGKTISKRQSLEIQILLSSLTRKLLQKYDDDTFASVDFQHRDLPVLTGAHAHARARAHTHTPSSLTHVHTAHTHV